MLCGRSPAQLGRFANEIGVNFRVRVLLVDDSPATRAFIRAALEAIAGGALELREASGGFEALRLLPRGPYDVVITDINMPDINGLELLNFIRKTPQHRATRVLLISTQKSEKDKQRGLQLGADAFLPKPFSIEQLKSALDRLLPNAAEHG
jgi:two-component system chemotaxis response regulator CheY